MNVAKTANRNKVDFLHFPRHCIPLEITRLSRAFSSPQYIHSLLFALLEAAVAPALRAHQYCTPSVNGHHTASHLAHSWPLESLTQWQCSVCDWRLQMQNSNSLTGTWVLCAQQGFVHLLMCAPWALQNRKECDPWKHSEGWLVHQEMPETFNSTHIPQHQCQS